MSKGSSGGKVVIEEEVEDDKGQLTKQLNHPVKSINTDSQIVVEETFYEADEDETSNMSMAIDDGDPKPLSGHLDNNITSNHEKSRTINFDESGSEALDLSFIPCSIPLKKRKISSLPNNNTQNEERNKLSDYRSPHQQFNHKIVTKDSIATSTTTIPTTSAFNQLTNNNRLNSFSLQSKPNHHFPFTLRAIPSATSSSSSSTPSPSSNNCKPLSLVKNQPQPQPQQQYPQLLQHPLPNQHHLTNHHHHHHQLQQQLHQHHHHINQQQHQKYIQYQQQQQQQQQQQLRLQDFTIGNRSTIVGSSTSGQTKGMSCRRPGFITCSICNATKYYSHVQRRFGQYSCEPCSKFMKRFLRDPKIFTCSQKGNCTIGKPSGEQEPRGVSVNRCKACWLKICLEKFILDSETKLAIDKYYAPKFSDSSGSLSSLLTTDVGDGSSGGCGDGESEGGSECSNNISTSSANSSGGLGLGGGGGEFAGEEGGEIGESKDAVRLRDGGGGSSGVEGEEGNGKSCNQPDISERIELNGCDTTISPPPLPFPQRKRKPKNEMSTSTSSSSFISTLSSSFSSSSSSSTTLSLSTQVTTTTPGNLINNNNGSTVPGETIPLSTSLSGNNSRIKDKHHHHPLHHSHQNQQYHSSSFYGGHLTSNASTGSGGGGHLSTEPLCLTTSGRRSDLSSSGLLGNLSSNSRSSFFPGGHLTLSHASLGPRYPWSHRRKDDYDLLTPSTTTAAASLTTPISFRRDLTRPFNHNDNLIIRRGSEDDLNDLYSGDYSLTSPDLLLSGPYVGVSHIIKDSNGDGDDNVTVMGSPATPPPPPARCGKCTYCLPTIDEKVNVVVVKENVGPVRCRLAEMMSKISQSNDKLEGGGGGGVGGNEDLEGGVKISTTTQTPSTATITTTSLTESNLMVSGRGVKRSNIKRSLSTTSKGYWDDIDEGQNTEDTVHSSTPTLNNIDNNKNNGNRRNRKERRGQSRGVTGGGGGGGVLVDKEESEGGTSNKTITSNVDGGDNVMNEEENGDREMKGLSRSGDGLYRKRLVSGDDDDNVQGVSIRYLNHDENHHGHHNNCYNNHHHQGNRSSSSLSTLPSSSSATTTITTNNNNKLNKSGLFNAKPYKKILINEHFINTSPTINNQTTSNSVINSNNPLLSRDLSGPIISPDSKFLSEILNANSPFL